MFMADADAKVNCDNRVKISKMNCRVLTRAALFIFNPHFYSFEFDVPEPEEILEFLVML